jgi:hypothetical protein
MWRDYGASYQKMTVLQRICSHFFEEKHLAETRRTQIFMMIKMG